MRGRGVQGGGGGGEEIAYRRNRRRERAAFFAIRLEEYAMMLEWRSD